MESDPSYSPEPLSPVLPKSASLDPYAPVQDETVDGYDVRDDPVQEPVVPRRHSAPSAENDKGTGMMRWRISLSSSRGSAPKHASVVPTVEEAESENQVSP